MPEEHLLILHRTRYNSIIPVCSCGKYYGTAHKIATTHRGKGTAKTSLIAAAEEEARKQFKTEHLGEKVET